MRRLCRAIATYLSSVLSWRSCWLVAEKQRFHTVERDGLLYIEPREKQGSGPVTPKGWLKL